MIPKMIRGHQEIRVYEEDEESVESVEHIKTSALDYNGERYLSSIINCVIFRL
jgi:hypothetical protein